MAVETEGAVGQHQSTNTRQRTVVAAAAPVLVAQRQRQQQRLWQLQRQGQIVAAAVMVITQFTLEGVSCSRGNQIGDIQ